MNPHERLARLAKVSKLVRVIDRAAAETGMNARKLADVLPLWLPEHAAELAAVAGCNPPSRATLREVLAHYEQRAR